jgi:hypothetical protein
VRDSLAQALFHQAQARKAQTPLLRLAELTDLVKDVNDAARNRNARISFAFVYPDRRGAPASGVT